MNKFAGQNNPNYKHGDTLIVHYCSCGNKISYTTYKYGKNKRRKCYLNQIRREYYCIDCGKQLSKRGCKRCYSCNTKGKRNPMYGKLGYNFGRKFAKSTIDKMRLAKKDKYFGKENPNWHNGISKLPYSIKFTEKLKESIRKRDENKCQLCNISNKKHKLLTTLSLSIHHIDYNKQNCAPNNLISLCNKCNAHVNSNRDYWYAYFKYIMEHLYA
jgi:hypothetical protein